MVTRKKVVTRKRIIIATILLVIAFLLLDVFIDSIFFHEGSFLDEILSPSPYELYIRTLCSVFMLGAGIFMAQAYGRELKTESKLRNLSGIVESSDDAILSLT